MSDKKQPEKSPESAKPKKILTEAEKAEKGREALARYMSWVMPLRAKGRHAFRGQADAKWGVTSSAYRRLKKEMPEILNIAESMFPAYLAERINEARMRFSEHGGKQPLEVMAQLQHYGAATGLIDFTESALAALWFTCKDEQDKPGRVFTVCLDNHKKIEEIKTRERIGGELYKFFPIEMSDKLWAWRPGDGNSRMVTQQSLFLFGRPEIGEDFFSKSPFAVAADEKKPLMEILESMGVSETFMFSDFAGFALANAHDKDYSLRNNYSLRNMRIYDEKIGDPQTPAEKKEKGPLYFKRGNLNHVFKLYQEAVEDYTCVIDVAPNASAHFNRGVALTHLGRHKEALADFTHAIEFNPQHAAAYVGHGRGLMHLGCYKEALADYTRAIKLDPQYAMAYDGRGNILDVLGRHEKALVDFTRAIELDPQYAPAYNNRGDVLSNLGRYEEALADFTRAIELDPQCVAAYFNRGIAYHNLKRYQEAASDWKETIRIGKQMGQKDIVQTATANIALLPKPK